MNIIIIGAGKVGYYLAKTLAPNKHRITMIEEDERICAKIAEELSDFGIVLIRGDGTDIELLQQAEAGEADLLIAVTGYDQNNLVACQLAKSCFSVPRTIARVNNPKNIRVFKHLGVDSVVSSTAHIADIIEHEVDWADVNRQLAKRMGEVRIREFAVEKGAGVIDKRVADLNLPKGTILISILRGENVIVPNGQTIILEDDSVIALTHRDSMQNLSVYFSKE